MNFQFQRNAHKHKSLSLLSLFLKSFCTLHSSNTLVPCLFDHLLHSFSSLKSIKQIHSALSTSGLISKDPHLSAQVIIKYLKTGDCESAESLFESIKGCNSFLWNTMMRGCANAGLSPQTLELYSRMRRTGISPNNYTFPFALKACASKLMILAGRSVHADAIRIGFESDLFVEATLVDMYAKCGEIDDGRKVFDGMPRRDLVSWTAMITGYEQAERGVESIEMFRQMQQQGLVWDSVTAVSVASAVGQLGDTLRAKSVHANVVRNGFLEDVIVANAIVAMYSKCGDVTGARAIFDDMRVKDHISWNSMLSGYSQNGRAHEALEIFQQMQFSRVRPNSVTTLMVVSACAYLGSPQLGRKIHSFIISSRMAIGTTLWNSIIDMYTKCGDLETAVRVFDSHTASERNVSSWNVMISGYGMHGYGNEALELFSRMQAEGIEPNHITFTCLLSACSHAGLVDEGRKCFKEMQKKFSMTPTVKHYACMVDLLGRAGLLKEARELIAEMQSVPNDGVWGALLGASRIHGNAEMGEFAAKNLLQLEPEHPGYYVLMSNIYAASNKWHEVEKLRKVMKRRGLKKPAAFSVIEFGKEVHGFHTAEQTHPQFLEVRKKVESLVIELKMAGYVPDISCVLHDLEEEDKEHILNLHSEKLAVAFGIMKIGPGTSIQVTKNLRVCNDCHSVFKLISHVHKRKIIVRDANRFHHFQYGFCSCKDYW